MVWMSHAPSPTAEAVTKALTGEFPEFDAGLIQALLEQEDGDEGEGGGAGATTDSAGWCCACWRGG
jgi:hypothetical protein